MTHLTTANKLKNGCVKRWATDKHFPIYGSDTIIARNNSCHTVNIKCKYWKSRKSRTNSFYINIWFVRFIAAKTNPSRPSSIRIVLPVALGKKRIRFVHRILTAKNYCRLVEHRATFFQFSHRIAYRAIHSSVIFWIHSPSTLLASKIWLTKKRSDNDSFCPTFIDSFSACRRSICRHFIQCFMNRTQFVCHLLWVDNIDSANCQHIYE